MITRQDNSIRERVGGNDWKLVVLVLCNHPHIARARADQTFSTREKIEHIRKKKRPLYLHDEGGTHIICSLENKSPAVSIECVHHPNRNEKNRNISAYTPA